MKVSQRGIVITELPAGARIERNENGNILIEGLHDVFVSAGEAREIRDALTVALGEDASKPTVSVLIDGAGDTWIEQSDGSYACVAASMVPRTREQIERIWGIRSDGIDVTQGHPVDRD